MTWSCAVGSCLLIPSGPTGEHLFAVVLGPSQISGHGLDDKIVIVSFTSVRPGIPYDAACEVAPGDHPFIKQPSYIYYREPRIESAKVVQERVESGQWKAHAPCSEELMERARAGFRRSNRLPRHFNQILDELGI